MFIDYNNINELIEYMICFYIPKINTSQFQVLCKPSLWCRIEIH